MPKLFVMSDIHGYYDEMKLALDKAGFDPNNEDHWVVTCGDHFDRGSKPIEVMRYLRILPRKVLVKGNHEELLIECCDRGFPGTHDYSNGTYGTICEIGGAVEGYSFDECCIKTLAKTHLFLDSMVNYFETKNYIFVHSWIPTNVEFDGDSKPWYQRGKTLTWMEDWRNANDVEWEEAMWGNPFKIAEQGLNKTGKTIIFGHWHSSTGWAKSEGRSEFGEDAKFEPYYGDGFIAIDACTAHSGKVNVLVIEDEFLERC